jgi:hypothetical protein
MLAPYFRFRVLNSTDQTITYDNAGRIEVAFVPWKFDTDGSLVYGSEQAEDLIGSGESVAAAAEVEGSVITNTATLWLGLTGTIDVVADQNSTDGTVYLYMETSTDNSVWPSDQEDFAIANDMIFVCAVALSTDAEDEGRSKNFEL